MAGVGVERLGTAGNWNVVSGDWKYDDALSGGVRAESGACEVGRGDGAAEYCDKAEYAECVAGSASSAAGSVSRESDGRRKACPPVASLKEAPACSAWLKLSSPVLGRLLSRRRGRGGATGDDMRSQSQRLLVAKSDRRVSTGATWGAHDGDQELTSSSPGQMHSNGNHGANSSRV